VLRLPAAVAPITAAVLPLVNKDGIDGIALGIDAALKAEGIPTSYDASGSIGRRYARMDEAGVPFCVTVDYQSKEDSTVTVRWRDTQEQVRVPIAHLAGSVRDLAGAD
jgi:glycyl-tRNA synthetase